MIVDLNGMLFALVAISEDADEKAKIAAMNGEYSDGGANKIKEQIKSFKEGIDFLTKGRIPEWIRPFIIETKKEKDPDYELYLKLHEKYGSRR